jgi:branched-chain amino acid transport system permease protein
VNDLVVFLLNGLGLGAIYAFIALGYTMVYGIIRLINFAHGEVFMVGAYIGYFVLKDLGLERLPLPQPWPVVISIVVALLLAGLGAGLLALIVERLAYRPVRKAGRIAALLTAVGVSLFLQNLTLRLFTATPRPGPQAREWILLDDLPAVAPGELKVDRTLTLSDGSTRREAVVVAAPDAPVDAALKERLAAEGHTGVFTPVTFSKQQHQAFVLMLLLLCAPTLWFLVKKTRMGKAMRAVSEDVDAARLMGIPIERVIMATFFLGAFVAGLGGVVYSATYGKVEPMLGFLPGLKAFVAAVIGGIGSIPGALLGGLVLGLVETLLPLLLLRMGWAEAFGWTDALVFLFLIVVLLVKPTGLLGQPLKEKV